MRNRLFPIVILSLVLCVSLPSPGGGVELRSPPGPVKISPGLRFWLSGKDAEAKVKIWVFFTDKGVLTQGDYRKALRDAEQALTDRARRRRLKARAGRDIVDFYDLPVHQPYVEKMEELGGRVMTVSKWLNGVSLSVPARLVPEIERLSFVREIRKVQAYRKERDLRVEKGARLAPPRRVPLYFDYGVSEPQLEQLNVPEAHSKGYTGSGVLICMLDTGFDYKYNPHKSLRHISSQLVAEWDFINNDPNTWHEGENDSIDRLDPAQTRHGTRMLSLIAGYLNNQLMGPAFGADFALAKTEWYRSGGEDVIAEEHWWIAGSEWADSLGADIISSSLGYRNWDDSTDYSYADMDGNTTPLTIAADIAASRGILVVTAMGNIGTAGATSRPDTCIKAPADADSIIAVGAVTEDGTWAWNDTTRTGSAIGPSYDQRDTLTGEPLPRNLRTRWKPELAAAWVAIVADPEDSVAIQGLAGTSCATALVAGASALIMQANPSWSNLEVREALLETASNHESPNDTLGWGIPDVWEAIYYKGEPEVPPFVEDELMDLYPNPFSPEVHSDGVVFPYRLINETYPFLRIYTSSGELVKEYDLGRKMPGRYLTGDTGAIRWDGHNEAGDLVGSGIYICILSTGYRNTIKKLAVIR